MSKALTALQEAVAQLAKMKITKVKLHQVSKSRWFLVAADGRKGFGFPGFSGLQKRVEFLLKKAGIELLPDGPPKIGEQTGEHFKQSLSRLRSQMTDTLREIPHKNPHILELQATDLSWQHKFIKPEGNWQAVLNDWCHENHVTIQGADSKPSYTIMVNMYAHKGSGFSVALGNPVENLETAILAAEQAFRSRKHRFVFIQDANGRTVWPSKTLRPEKPIERIAREDREKQDAQQKLGPVGAPDPNARVTGVAVFWRRSGDGLQSPVAQVTLSDGRVVELQPGQACAF